MLVSTASISSGVTPRHPSIPVDLDVSDDGLVTRRNASATSMDWGSDLSSVLSSIQVDISFPKRSSRIMGNNVPIVVRDMNV